MAKKICFLSDLHLLSQRSNADLYISELRRAAERNDVFVFGGDIFDFKWSKLASLKSSFEFARNWLEDFIHPFPNVQFFYLLGNHDCCDPFVRELGLMAKSLSNFRVCPNTLQLGSSVFLHGDIVHGPPAQSMLDAKRKKWAVKNRKGPLPNAIYDLVVASKVHRLLARTLNRNDQLANHLLAYLDELGQGRDAGVSDVYFGHTHWSTEFDYQGIRFHNGGAAIRGLAFRWIESEIDVDLDA